MGFGTKLLGKVGIKPPKDMSYEENQQHLDDLGIMRKKNKEDSRYKEKFSAYGAMAKDLSRQQENELVPEGYEQYSANGENPYVYDRRNARPEDYSSTKNGKKSRNKDDLNSSYNPYKHNIIKAEQESPYSQYGYENDGPHNNKSNNPYAQNQKSQSDNPYQVNNETYSQEPDEQKNQSVNPYSTDYNPYESGNSNSNNPYASFNNKKNANGSNAINQNNTNTVNKQNSNPYSNASYSKPGFTTNRNESPQSNGYGSANPQNSIPYTSSRINPYKSKNNTVEGMGNNDPEDQFDFEETPSVDKPEQYLSKSMTNNTDFNSPPVNNASNTYSNATYLNTIADEEDDLNASINEDDAAGGDQAQMYYQQQPEYETYETENFNENPEISNQQNNFVTFEEMQKQQQEQQQREEDEEVDTIKQQIKFTKQASAASTRNTLKMARDAELAGMNTLGMLGSQSEKLGNIENNITLMKIQNREADDKVSELKKLNRSVFAVHVSNPFTSKRKARQLEENIKSQREMDKEMQRETRHRLMESTNSVSHTMKSMNNERMGKTPTYGADSIRERYSRDQILKDTSKYTFEGDEEDEDLEVEIDRNLDEIGNISKRLKNIALQQSQEVERQQSRLNEVEQDTDNLDIKLYWNTKRLQNIK